MKKRNIDSSDIFALCFSEDMVSPLDMTVRSSTPHTDRLSTATAEKTAQKSSAMQNYNNTI